MSKRLKPLEPELPPTPPAGGYGGQESSVEEKNMKKRKIIILGAAGRDFHNFNVVYRDNPKVEVVAFTATQIPNIDGRKYPAELAGHLYPNGIPIHSEDDLVKIIKEQKVDECVFSYSDVSYNIAMHVASKVVGNGAKFSLLGTNQTMLKAAKPVIAITAVRTGCGKSQTTRKVIKILKAAGKKAVAIRHPMPYGDLVAQRVQRFAELDDLKKHDCTIEEMEEYEPHIMSGTVVYAGVDYGAILEEAEKEADVIVWDGGNNDTSFYKPDLLITVVDPLRPNHEKRYFPGEVNFRMADVIVINKMDSAKKEDVATVMANINNRYNPKATVIRANSLLKIEKPELIKGKKVLVVEDGPTLTHGGMKIGAGTVAAERCGAADCVDPRPWVVGEIAATFRKYPFIGSLLPAMGYGEQQIKDLEATINAVKTAEAVVIGTPIDLARFVKINKPFVRVKYELEEIGSPNLTEVLDNKGLFD